MIRPQFHFTAETGWINDPHAITYRNGRFHLFYQYVPGSLVWAPNCYWGHAVSDDLFVFEHLPIALAPGDGDDGIWTGSLATDQDGQDTIFYTSVVQPDIGIGRVRSATADDDSWISWTKGAVVAERPADLDIVAYRDPFVFRDGDGWRMLVGASIADGTAAALSYGSTNLRDWDYEGIGAQRSTRETDPLWTGALWECAQLFEIDGRHLMVSSVWDDDVLYYAAYSVGTYRGGVFEAESWGRLSYGTSYYAPSFFHDADGRPSLTFWLRHVADPEAGWAGAHSVPHSLHLEGDRLVATPHSGLEAYRGEAKSNGRVLGTAADAVWSPGSSLTVSSGATVVAALSMRPGQLVLTHGDAESCVPYETGEVRVIVDAAVIEVSLKEGVIAAPIVLGGNSLEFDADGALQVWPLVPH